MIQFQSLAHKSVAAWPLISRPIVRVLAGAALLCIGASASADQLLVTGANANGNSVYDLNLTPSSATPPTPVIANATTAINSDGKKQGSFDALVWASNAFCKSLDLIVADVADHQIVRYQGASTVSGCYNPTAKPPPTVSPTAQVIFKWSKLGSGPAQPNGLSVDANGNLFVVSSSGLLDPKPSVWVLPFNQTAKQNCSNQPAGAYCAPVLIDNKFGGVLTLALSETLVAGTTTPLWSAGDLLVLVGDSFDARLTVYKQSAIYGNNTNGVIATGGLPAKGPSSTPIPFSKFIALLADPFGMDIWPANATTGTNTAVLFTTIDGRILRFDTVQNKFIANFANSVGPGLEKLRVGTYANVPYAFVAQVLAKGTGQILAFAAPPASGANKPLAAVTSGVLNPIGLAVSSSASTPVPQECTTPSCGYQPLVVAPLGPVATTTFSPPPGVNFTGTITEQDCIVDPDPRVTIGEESAWSCSGADLMIGSGTAYCPSFPASIIPGSVCGHSGPDVRGFAVIEGTALGVDPVDNNTFFQTALNIDTVLPGPGNLECNTFGTTGLIPLTAWGTRSDLTTVEGSMVEDSPAFGTLFPDLGGAPGYLADLTSTCDLSTSGGHGISMFAFGLALSNNTPSYVYSLQFEKYSALQSTVEAAAITPTVQTTLEAGNTTAETYISAAEGGVNATANLDCALAQIYATDLFLRETLAANPTAFSSNLVSSPPGGGNTDPAADIDSRLANWYLTINTEILLNAPPPPPALTGYPLPFPVPASSVPPACYTIGGTVSGLTGSGPVLQDSFTNTSLNYSGTDSDSVTGNGTFTFPTALATGSNYNVTVMTQPAEQTCSVTNGSGTVGTSNIANITVTCSTTVTGNVVINYFTLGFTAPTEETPGYSDASFFAPNATQCNFTSLYGSFAPSFVLTGPPLTLEDTIQNAYSNNTQEFPPASGPGYGTDTYALTCYGAAGTPPATIAPILNASGTTPVTQTPLAIDGFGEDFNGNLVWETVPTPNSATCTLIDEFGGTLPSYITSSGPAIQSPITGLPGMEPVTPSSPDYVSPNACAVEDASPVLLPDTLTLVCSDPNLGTAVAQLVWTTTSCAPAIP
jgi:hypothetical protein